MAEDTKTQTEQGATAEGTTPEATPEPTSMKMFTQEDVNRLIGERLKQERAAREKEDADRKRAEEIAKLDGEERLKAEHKAQLDKIAAERDEAVRANAVLKAGEELAKMGYSTELAPRLLGATEDETKAAIAAFDKAVKAEAERMVNSQLARGAPPAQSASMSEADRIKAAMKRGYT